MSSPTFGNLHVGDVHDDDATIIDHNVLEVDAPPTPVVEPIDSVTLIQPARCTRLLTKHYSLDPTWNDPVVLILPADANRKYLYVRVTSPTAVATDGVYFADDKGKLTSAYGEAARLFHGQVLQLDNHTGPLYATAAPSSAPMVVDVWAVTD